VVLGVATLLVKELKNVSPLLGMLVGAMVDWNGAAADVSVESVPTFSGAGAIVKAAAVLAALDMAGRPPWPSRADDLTPVDCLVPAAGPLLAAVRWPRFPISMSGLGCRRPPYRAITVGSLSIKRKRVAFAAFGIV
jgi:hypothetical protein